MRLSAAPRPDRQEAEVGRGLSSWYMNRSHEDTSIGVVQQSRMDVRAGPDRRLSV